MGTIHLLRRRCASILACVLPAILVALLGVFCTSPASAGLIIDSMRYDGRVRSGSTTGVEKHSTTVDLPPNPGSLPADNSMLPAPLLNGNNLSTHLAETFNQFQGEFVRHATLTIQNPFPIRTFNNTLDPNLPYPVEFEAIMYSDSLDPGEMIDMKGIGIENFNFAPYPPPGIQVITGAGNSGLPLGSPGNPMRVQLGIAANQVDDYRYGFVKINFYYGIGEIPEPSSLALLILGIVGAAGLRRCR
jgi:hypothetical protein